MAGVWFRKGLRLHDNAALAEAAKVGDQVFPFFILDPFFDRSRVGVNRFQFLLESLRDLDHRLRTQHGSRLLVLRGPPEEVLAELLQGGGPFRVTALFWERDLEPYARRRDARVEALANKLCVPTRSFPGHALLDTEAVVASLGFKPPISMRDVEALVGRHGPVPPPQPEARIPPLDVQGFEVPDISELYDEAPTSRGFPGGEGEALRRLRAVCADTEYVCGFEKPKTASTGRPGKPWEPSTTGLSPYLKFGCLSARTAWHALVRCCEGRAHTRPPQSLQGQLLFREMFYLLGAAVPNFDQAEGNPMCRPIPWDEDATLLEAWASGRTGYPFIDALMRQLRETGHMHHLGRHAVACFLTRGDLWQSWLRGRDVFDRLLLDADWALNNGNWLWLAGVAPFSAPYFRVYDPCPGPRSSLNALQAAEFVRHFVPELGRMPDRYILRPWEAPAHVQRQAGCVIGEDYPAPVVDHAQAREANIQRFKEALDAQASGPLPEKFRGAVVDPGPKAARWAAPARGAAAAAAAGGGKRPGGRDAAVAAAGHVHSGQAKLHRWVRASAG